MLSPVVQFVASLIADPGFVSLIPALLHTFGEIDCEIFSMVILLHPLIQEGLLSEIGKVCAVEYWLTN